MLSAIPGLTPNFRHLQQFVESGYNLFTVIRPW